MQKNLWQKCIFIAKNTFLPKQLNICLMLVALELCTQSVVAYAVVDDNDLSVLDHLDGLGLSSSIGNAVSRVFHNQHDVGNVERIAGFFVELDHPVTGISQTSAQVRCRYAVR